MRSIVRTARAPGTRPPAAATPLQWSPPARCRVRGRPRRRCRAAAQTAAPSRACRTFRAGPGRLVVRIRGGALNPEVASFEELAFPDRRNLLDALDRVTARGVCAPAMRRSGRNRHARLPDL